MKFMKSKQPEDKSFQDNSWIPRTKLISLHSIMY
jgi:hypothetical protein